MKIANLALVALLALNLIPAAHADIKNSPFPPYLDQRFDANEDRLDTLEAASESAAGARKYARVTYDVSVDGGQSSPSTHSLGVTLPAGAVVTSVLVYINSAFSGGTQSESLAFQCNAGQKDLMDWQNMEALGINALIYGGLTPTAPSTLAVLKGGDTPAPAQAGWVSIPTACEVKALVRNNSGYTPYSTGNATAVIEYFIK